MPTSFSKALILAVFAVSTASQAEAITLTQGPCTYQETVQDDTVTVGVSTSGGPRADFTLPAADVPLADGYTADISDIQRLVNVKATASYKRGTLRLYQQGSTDFLETSWLTVNVDSTLEHPTKATVWYGMGGIPFQFKICRFK